MKEQSRSRITSGVVGGALLVIATLWLGWLIFFQNGNIFLSPISKIPGHTSQATPEPQIPPLLAVGITLGHADQKPALNQQQVLLLASQVEPVAATKASVVSARYVLLNYTNAGPSAAHPNISRMPVWMVWYQKIPLGPNDTVADHASTARTFYDLYIFLDATTCKELLAVRV